MNNVSKGYEDISVELIDFNEKIAEHAWNCYRMTWHELQDVKYDPENPVVVEAVDNIIKFRALPMPREQAIMTFRVNNTSRVELAQITRQRKAAFNVESQMPRPITHNVIIPLNLYGTEFEARAIKLAKDSQALYDDMISAGMPPQDARYVTLHGQTTSFVYVVDINTFVGSFGMRCENNLSDEINLVYRLCKKAILDAVKAKFEAGEIDKLTYKFYTDIITPADAAGAARKVCQNYDKVFGNSFKRYPGANAEVDAIVPDYDYTKSAWYFELKRIANERPELLLPDEDKMIESWS